MPQLNQWFEKVDSQAGTIARGGASEQSQYTKCWMVYAGEDAVAAYREFSTKLDGESGTVPGKNGDYFFNFDRYTARHLGNGYWEVEATYVCAGGGEQDNQDPNNIGVAYSLGFDSTGGTQRITQAIDERRFSAPGKPAAPDMKKAILVSGDSVEGCDIVVPVFEWNEDIEIPGGNITAPYVREVAKMTGKVNDAPFRGFPKGDVLFLGVSGQNQFNPNQASSYTDAQVARISFRFAYKPTQENFQFGTCTVTKKEGWEFIWATYEDANIQGVTLKQVAHVYVQRVYEYGDFSLLKIGTT
jgi:hypothetical protein